MTDDIVAVETPLSFGSLADAVLAKSTRFMNSEQLDRLIRETLEPLFPLDSQAFCEAKDGIYEELNQRAIRRLTGGKDFPQTRITAEEVHVDELLRQVKRQRKNRRGFTKHSELSGKDLAAGAGVEERTGS